MDDAPWLRIITIGLILAAIAVGYFLISGRLMGPKTTQISDSQVTQMATPSPTPEVFGQITQASPTPGTSSAYNQIVDRTKGNIKVLPQTGAPVITLGLLSASAMIIGWGLKKYPH